MTGTELEKSLEAPPAAERTALKELMAKVSKKIEKEETNLISWRKEQRDSPTVQRGIEGCNQREAAYQDVFYLIKDEIDAQERAGVKAASEQGGAT
jgi:hypothetical protein